MKARHMMNLFCFHKLISQANEGKTQDEFIFNPKLISPANEGKTQDEFIFHPKTHQSGQ